MTELVLVLTHFLPPNEPAAGAEHPRLPQLEGLLARSRRTHVDGDWRAWLAACAAPRELGQFSPAALAVACFRGAGIPQPDNTGYWLATPVYFFAGLDSVHLHPAGLVSLSAEEQRALVADFARVFADSAWRLQAIGHRELLLSGPPLQASGADPARFLGEDPRAGLAQGADAAALRRLGSEIEMWLYEHPINQARVARDQMPATGLWLWGGEPPAAPAGVRRLQQPQLYGADIYAQSLWQLQGRRALALSQASQAIQAVPMALSSDSVVLLTNGLQQLEQDWLPAAVRALRRRQLSRLSLMAGSQLFQASPLQRLRFWHRPAPWWEMLG